jgi:hypothetical protein
MQLTEGRHFPRFETIAKSPEVPNRDRRQLSYSRTTAIRIRESPCEK